MKIAFKIILLLLFVTSGISAQILSKPPAQVIPEFKFFRLNNMPFTNQDLPGAKLIFFMFVDPDCDHCQHAIEAIGEHYTPFQKTAFYIVSLFDQNKINHFMDTYGSKLKGKKNITVLQDKLQQFILKFNPRKYPSMFLFSSKRKLIDYEDTPESVPVLSKAINKNVK